jgi:hypothetical protein
MPVGRISYQRWPVVIAKDLYTSMYLWVVSSFGEGGMSDYLILSIGFDGYYFTQVLFCLP